MKFENISLKMLLLTIIISALQFSQLKALKDVVGPLTEPTQQQPTKPVSPPTSKTLNIDDLISAAKETGKDKAQAKSKLFKSQKDVLQEQVSELRKLLVLQSGEKSYNLTPEQRRQVQQEIVDLKIEQAKTSAESRNPFKSQATIATQKLENLKNMDLKDIGSVDPVFAQSLEGGINLAAQEIHSNSPLKAMEFQPMTHAFEYETRPRAMEVK